MRILVLNIDYTGFLDSLYQENPGLAGEPYARQMRLRNESLFGVADFYSRNLNALGHEALELHANNEPMQRAWAREHGVAVRYDSGKRWQLRMRRKIVPWVSKLPDTRWMYEILAAQIRHYKPDVILNQVLDGISHTFLREMKQHTRLLVGQFAAPLPEDADMSVYDLFISSLPNFVDRFRAAGIASELNRLAFEPAILDVVPEQERIYPISFIGSISRHHDERGKLIEGLCREFDIRIFGQGVERLPQDSPVRQHHGGPAWGKEMYRILGRSKIALNHHIAIAGPYANNMRLYEATGMGAMLLTDWKENLHEMFEPGGEVAAYRSHDECFEMIRYYLDHQEERQAIATAGQKRTLREHTYLKRMEEFTEIVGRYL